MPEQTFKKYQKYLKENGTLDGLTKCYTKPNLLDLIPKLINESNETGEPFSVVFIDFDKFKKYNDKQGHLFGDNILTYVASTIRLTLEEKGFVFRYGGDEFVVVLPERDSKETFELSRTCNYNVSNRPFLYVGKLYTITVSMGIASYPTDGLSMEELFSKADTAMYVSKKFGGGLATEVSRVAYIRVRNALAMIIVSGLIIFSIFYVNRYVHKEFIQRAVKEATKIRITVEEKPKGKRATIMLKNGHLFRGYVQEETEDSILASFDTGVKETVFKIDKSEVVNIIYE